MRIGHGYDVHRLTAGRRLILGGVEISSEVGLDGHSDADVLAHAITDAVLGAAAMGDIGAHFPDTDAEWKDADSIGLLREVVARVRARGWQVGNVDATVVLQAPKLRPHIDAMRQRLAGALGVELDAVSVKATTGEGMGWVGSGEGAAAHAVALLLASGDASSDEPTGARAPEAS
jgi:2-C-methyl-D-erythritol 2,4-cyclodiphosphate synthase